MQKTLNKQLYKNVSMNVQWTCFPNLSLENDIKQGDLPSINQSINQCFSLNKKPFQSF